MNVFINYLRMSSLSSKKCIVRVWHSTVLVLTLICLLVASEANAGGKKKQRDIKSNQKTTAQFNKLGQHYDYWYRHVYHNEGTRDIAYIIRPANACDLESPFPILEGFTEHDYIGGNSESYTLFSAVSPKFTKLLPDDIPIFKIALGRSPILIGVRQQCISNNKDFKNEKTIMKAPFSKKKGGNVLLKPGIEEAFEMEIEEFDNIISKIKPRINYACKPEEFLKITYELAWEHHNEINLAYIVTDKVSENTKEIYLGDPVQLVKNKKTGGEPVLKKSDGGICSECYMSFSNAASFSYHKNKCYNEKYQNKCTEPSCKKSFLYPSQLENHLASIASFKFKDLSCF